MKRHSYRERDYTFGQTMLTLRTSIGLTQAGLGSKSCASSQRDSRSPRSPHTCVFVSIRPMPTCVPSTRSWESPHAVPPFGMRLSITSPEKKSTSPSPLTHLPHPDSTVHHMNVLDTGFQVTHDETAQRMFTRMFM